MMRVSTQDDDLFWEWDDDLQDWVLLWEDPSLWDEYGVSGYEL